MQELEKIETSKFEVVQKFIYAYNSFDVKTMLSLLHPEIEFKNISNGIENAHTQGLEEFKDLAYNSLKIFETRTQKIISYSEKYDTINVEVDYQGILAEELPNGLKSGDSLNIKGKSKYVFKDNLIISLIYYS